MDVSSILSIIQQHWLEILIILAIGFILRNIKWIAIAVLIFIALSYFGLLDQIKDVIFGQRGIILDFLKNYTSTLINQTINETLNQTINQTISNLTT
ncbi:hypothetical protein [Methanotorris igneus]|uniref:Uncharacterized protein n=1 Tax=Methanotorris igneus (strain DSM 5666 / JCM 11834 / Kol 5) TaxID=880724 RepID=F6BBP6_METIK|nr:hypothetical protein [Methanotorris igneus]AEF96055.1 hypothetical protein Metig_0499 [Methanotorris igneus Kol 5]